MVGITLPRGGDMEKATYDTNVSNKVDDIDMGKITASKIEKIVSATVRHGVSDNSDEVQHQLNETLTTVKTFVFTDGLKGTVRLKMELKTDNISYKLRGRWYHEAVAIGTEQTGDDADVYDAKSEDIAVNIAAGESLYLKVICLYGSSYPLNYVRNMNISYDNVLAVAVT